MGIGEGQDGDHPPSISAMTPEEAMQKLFPKPEAIEHKWREIKRGEFMMALNDQIEQGTKLWLQAENEANEAQGHANTARLIIFLADNMRRKANDAEANDYRVNFFVDQFGNLSIEPMPREDIGFKKGGGE